MEVGEESYYEVLVYFVMFVYLNLRKVFVIGGGDGGMFCEVFRYDIVEKVIMVEIDEGVVEVFYFYFDVVKDFLDRFIKKEELWVELIIGDGVKYFREIDECFDVIIVDLIDLVGFVKFFFSEEFYRDVYEKLNEKGFYVI